MSRPIGQVALANPILVGRPLNDQRILERRARASVVTEEWVVAAISRAVVNPSAIVVMRKLISVPIAKVITIATRSNKQVRKDCRISYDSADGAVMIIWRQVNRPRKSNRRKRHAAVFNHPIPEPGTINISARCPNISGRNPNPILCERLPKSWSPLVNLILIDPATGNVEMIVTRCG